MTTPIVQSITDEIIEGLERRVSIGIGMHVTAEEIKSILQRLRDAEADVERLNKLDTLCESYGFEGIHEGNRWMIDGPFRDIRAAIDGMHSDAERTP